VLSLLSDPDPKHDEEKERLEHEDPSTIAINTVRGTALEVLLYYAFRRRGALGDPPYPPLGAFAPEVVDQLDGHLDPVEEPSLAIRSVYGKWFPQLYGLDKEWALGARARIFTSGDLPRLEAAWNAYLAFSRVYTDIYRALEQVYELAIQ